MWKTLTKTVYKDGIKKSSFTLTLNQPFVVSNFPQFVLSLISNKPYKEKVLKFIHISTPLIVVISIYI